MRYKYPRTPHLPWSPGASSDDIRHADLAFFDNKQVVVTEKMDGENTSIYADFSHARSIDSRFHPSRSRVKTLQAEIGYLIPPAWRICGENLYARHAIAYRDLPGYFMAFSLWNEDNLCLSWQESKTWFKKLGLDTPKELYRGPWCGQTIKAISVDTRSQEGYVVRNSDSFHYRDFGRNVAKWVRENHVATDKHWMHRPLVANELKEVADENT